mmetsp:Transcript_1608/g.4828  ORF Transcript_1608/g.4828 Transcript_1608/m.4828 type:complete len:252 (+) Transcript_1608:72-827(+)
MTAELKSCIYEGTTTHRRAKPEQNKFVYNVFMVLIDLDELRDGKLERWPVFSSATRWALASFQAEDHMAMESIANIDSRVRSIIEARTGARPGGLIRLLTNLRYGGIGFNPVSFFYVYDDSGEYVEAVVAEVGNIPWFEQHCYVSLRAKPTQQASAYMVDFGSQAKEFHVSPFMKMEKIMYQWGFNDPCEKLLVHIGLNDDGKPFFYADLDLTRSQFTAFQLARSLITQPMFTFKVIVGIHLVSQAPLPHA